MFGDLIDFLIEWLVCLIQTAAVLTVNALAVAVGALWGVVVDLLPDMPDVPPYPDQWEDAMWLANQIVDVDWLVSFVLSFWVSMSVLFGVMILLRWMKASE